ncbi:hypothetical protein ACSBR2_036175 [Camellia fascicularis]
MVNCFFPVQKRLMIFLGFMPMPIFQLLLDLKCDMNVIQLHIKTTGKYWDKVDEQWKREPKSIMLADKNAPNEEVWLRIEETCRRMRASAVPVVSDSEGLRWNLMIMCYCSPFVWLLWSHVIRWWRLVWALPGSVNDLL